MWPFEVTTLDIEEREGQFPVIGDEPKLRAMAESSKTSLCAFVMDDFPKPGFSFHCDSMNLLQSSPQLSGDFYCVMQPEMQAQPGILVEPYLGGSERLQDCVARMKN